MTGYMVWVYCFVEKREKNTCFADSWDRTLVHHWRKNTKRVKVWGQKNKIWILTKKFFLNFFSLPRVESLIVIWHRLEMSGNITLEKRYSHIYSNFYFFFHVSGLEQTFINHEFCWSFCRLKLLCLLQDC